MQMLSNKINHSVCYWIFGISFLALTYWSIERRNANIKGSVEDWWNSCTNAKVRSKMQFIISSNMTSFAVCLLFFDSSFNLNPNGRDAQVHQHLCYIPPTGQVKMAKLNNSLFTTGANGKRGVCIVCRFSYACSMWNDSFLLKPYKRWLHYGVNVERFEYIIH